MLCSFIATVTNIVGRFNRFPPSPVSIGVAYGPTSMGGGGQTEFCVAEFFPLPTVTYPKFGFFHVNSSNRPKIRVSHTCIVFCPNNVDSLPEFMSTNCPNWGGGQLPPAPLPPVPYAYASVLTCKQKCIADTL